MHILVKYASRSRPQKFFEGLHNLLDMAADKEKITILCCLDKDDPTMFRDNFPSQHFQKETFEHTVKFSNVVFDWGKSESKIDAINRKIPEGIEWDILVNFSDDMRFTVFGWDQLIRDHIAATGPDTFLHFPDSTAGKALPTMSIMDKAYYDRDGYVYHPSYKSLWADNEAADIAEIRGRYHFIPTQIFDHYHPSYGMAEWDDQYKRQQDLWDVDYRNYNYRRDNKYFEDGTA